ncbi:unnamed protein product [Parnassius apollo]|uniref:(apollo) hypothetical protein n=1 Tax=Parnassius apollo TaxID=110799 RepID=A0A8S3XP75_PARAO|nr:unnamed protein product [Parnassius apollo]
MSLQKLYLNLLEEEELEVEETQFIVQYLNYRWQYRFCEDKAAGCASVCTARPSPASRLDTSPLCRAACSLAAQNSIEK